MGFHTGRHWIWLFSAPFANVDSLALGGILAFAWNEEGRSPNEFRSRLLSAGVWLGAPLALGLWITNIYELSGPRLSIFRVGFENTILAILFVWLIDRSARGFSGTLGWLLQLRPLQYLGKISYGLYVIHLFVPSALRWLFQRLAIPDPPHGAPEFGLWVAATIAVAAASWHLYEKPLNDLKERFSGPDRSMPSSEERTSVVPGTPAAGSELAS